MISSLNVAGGRFNGSKHKGNNHNGNSMNHLISSLFIHCAVHADDDHTSICYMTTEQPIPFSFNRPD